MNKVIRIAFLISILFQQITNAFVDPEKLIELRDSENVIRVTEDNYHLVNGGSQNYYNVLYITMDENLENTVQCDICQTFEPIFRKVATAFKEQAPQSTTLFFIASVNDVPSLVKDLELKAVPHLVIYPPPQNENFSWATSPFYQYQLNDDTANSPLQFGDYLAKLVQVYIQIDTEFDINEFLQYFISFMVVFIVIKRGILPRLSNKLRFGMMIVSFGILLPSITGYKFSQMNAVPLIARNEQNQIMFFSGGTGWQFGIEIITVSIMYIVMSTLTIFLIMIPTLRSNNSDIFPVVSTITACALFYFFSYFTSCFDIKSPAYPYKF